MSKSNILDIMTIFVLFLVTLMVILPNPDPLYVVYGLVLAVYLQVAAHWIEKR